MNIFGFKIVKSSTYETLVEDLVQSQSELETSNLEVESLSRELSDLKKNHQTLHGRFLELESIHSASISAAKSNAKACDHESPTEFLDRHVDLLHSKNQIIVDSLQTSNKAIALLIEFRKIVAHLAIWIEHRGFKIADKKTLDDKIKQATKLIVETYPKSLQKMRQKQLETEYAVIAQAIEKGISTDDQVSFDSGVDLSNI